MTALLQHIYFVLSQGSQAYNEVDGNIFIGRGESNPMHDKYILMEVVSQLPTGRSKSGVSDMDTFRIQFTCYAQSAAAADTIANYLRWDLDYTGNGGDAFNPIPEAQYQSCMFDTEADNTFDFQSYETGMFAKQIDFIIRINPIILT